MRAVGAIRARTIVEPELMEMEVNWNGDEDELRRRGKECSRGIRVRIPRYVITEYSELWWGRGGLFIKHLSCSQSQLGKRKKMLLRAEQVLDRDPHPIGG